MPLLWSGSPNLEANQLNMVKKKIFKSSVDQYTNLTNIQSNIQPSQSQMNENFSKITLFLKQMLNAFKVIINAPTIINQYGHAIPNYTEIGNKLSIDYGPLVQDFIHTFELNIYPLYNYFNPQQNQIIKDLLIKVSDLGTQMQNYGIGDNPTEYFIETLSQGLSLLGQAIDSYSPLKITLRKGRQLLPIEELEGGYISGGSRNKGQKYPEIRFL